MARITRSEAEGAMQLLFTSITRQLRMYEDGLIRDDEGNPKLPPASLTKQMLDLMKLMDVAEPEDDIKPALEIDKDFMALHDYRVKNDRPVSDDDVDRYNMYQSRLAKQTKQEEEVEQPADYHEARASQTPVESYTEAWCTACKAYHPRSAFSKNKRRSTGLQSSCKAAVKRKRDARKAKEASNEQQ